MHSFEQPWQAFYGFDTAQKEEVRDVKLRGRSIRSRFGPWNGEHVDAVFPVARTNHFLFNKAAYRNGLNVGKDALIVPGGLEVPDPAVRSPASAATIDKVSPYASS